MEPTVNLHDGLITARQLQQAGQRDRARDLLNALAAAFPKAHAPHFRLAQLALEDKDYARFDAHAAAARVHLPDGEALALEIITVEAEMQRHRFAAAAARLTRLLEAEPHRIGLWARLAEAARRDGRPEAALAALDRVIALAPPGDLATHLRRLDLLVEIGGVETLQAGLAQVPQALLTHCEIQLKWVTALRHAKDLEGARRHARAALASAPDDRRALQALIRACMDLGDQSEAVRVLDGRLGDPEVSDAVLLMAARQARDMADLQRERDILHRVIAAYPASPALLQYLLVFHSFGIGPEKLGAILDRVGAVHPLPLTLRLTAAQRRLDFAAALRMIRTETGPRRDPDTAQKVAQILQGARRFHLAYRYLRAASRRWPNSGAILAALVNLCLNMGRNAKAERALAEARAASHVPESELLYLEYRCAALGGDLDRCLSAYRSLAAQRRIARIEREPLLHLLFATLDPWQGESIIAEMDAEEAERLQRVERVSFTGQIKLEYMLERRLIPEGPPPAGAAGQNYRSAQAQMRRSPDLTRPAIRLVGAWRDMAGSAARLPAEPEREPPHPGPPIPRRIFQYWDAAQAPPDLAPLMQGWADLPGYAYVLHDRKSGRDFLGDTYGGAAARAFLMAGNPTEEADFLRLGLLAAQGGIWADTDDALYGDPATLIGDSHGLWCFREAPIGTVANNFLAASPGHPVIVNALAEAEEALLGRSAEWAWFKTGPALLTRAMGRILADPPADCPPVAIARQSDVRKIVAMHCPALHKTMGNHWSRIHGRSAQFWQPLDRQLSDPQLSAPRPRTPADLSS